MLGRAALLTVLTLGLALSHAVRGQENASAGGASGAAPAASPSPTRHPPVPQTAAHYWLVPDTDAGSLSQADAAAAGQLVRGISLISSGDFAAGLPLVSTGALSRTPLWNHAQYYTAVALIGLSRHADAEPILDALAERKPQGHLAEMVPHRITEVALALDNPRRALEALDDLDDDDRLVSPDAALLQRALAEEKAGSIDRALDAFRRIFYDFPLSPLAVDAEAGIKRLETPGRIPPDRYTRERDRAQALFQARRWAQARAAFEPLAKVARGDDAELIALRLAECDYYLNRFRVARDRLVPFLDGASREAEARFFHLTATQTLGDRATYVRLARGLVRDHPDSSWAEETLHNLASHFIVFDDEAEADRVFRELMRRFPRSRHSERAAWKIGWRAYRDGDFRETAEVFERAAVTFPRADYRPAWLYWSARSRAQLDEPERAAELYRVAIADYRNSYYGRLATKAMASRRDVQRVASVQMREPAPGTAGIPTEGLIRELIARGLYDDALREVGYAQRVWGDSAKLQATTAFIRYSQALTLKAEERFTALRGAINTMRRAYPQFMAAGGDQLPPDVLRIIFPLDYWPLITKYSKAHGLDPYLMAALMAQESTFTPEIRSSANAIGLMQLIPGTGRRYARKLGISNFTTNSLTRPETNVRLGMQYFKDLMDRFGGAHFALASYNAGENRVERWIAERPSLPADEFVDDIPFPETQTYVKRILGTAEDYRFLYGGGLLDPNATLSASAGEAPRGDAAAGARDAATLPVAATGTAARPAALRASRP